MKIEVKSDLQQKQLNLNSFRERYLTFIFWKSRNKDFKVEYQPWSAETLWDAIIYSAGTGYIVETKYRYYNLEKYNEWYIEIDLYNRLNRLAHQKGLNPWYINFTKDNYVVIWNLNQAEVKPHSDKRQESKVINSTKSYNYPGFKLNINEAIIYKIPNLNYIKDIRLKLAEKMLNIFYFIIPFSNKNHN